MLSTEMVSKFTKKALGLTFVLSAAAMAFAQQKVEVSGTIVNSQKIPVPYASVNFSNKSNVQFSDAVLTDEKGNYTIQLVPGNYDITVEAIDHKSATKNLLVTGGRLASILLEAENSVTGLKTEAIQGVTITSTAKPYRVELDKKTYDPSSDIVSKGGNLQDVLQNVPSINVETDGTVSMRGSSNVKFLINGKPSALLGIDDGAAALQSIPADQIEKIEVITNPSSKFEAAGTAGILNIILKKNKKAGFNGSVTGTIGYFPQTSLNANLGWRKGNWSWFVNGGGGYRETESKRETETTYKNVPAGKITEFNQKLLTESSNNNYNASAGVNYDITEKASLNISGTVRSYQSEGDGNIDIVTKYNGLPTLFSHRDQDSRGKNLAFQGDVGYDQKLDDNGQLLSLSASFQRNKSNNNSDFLELVSGTQIRDEKQLQETLNRSFVGKADYEKPIGEKSKIEAGYRLDVNRNSYDNNLTAVPTFSNISFFNNNTDYREVFNAGYIQFKSKIGEKFGYQLGVRDEYSTVDINYRNDAGEIIDKTKQYNGIFPSVYLSYDLAKGSQLLLNYARRIDRPRSFFMVPYAMYSNPETVFEGNIDLDPSYVNSFELGYSLQKGKITLNPTLYYRKTEDDVKMLTYQKNLGENILYTKPINLGTDERYGLDLNFSYDPVKWLRLMGSLGVFGYHTQGLYDFGNGLSRDFSGDGVTTNARLNANFRVDKTFNFQFQGFYRGGQETATTKIDPMYALNFGASKTIWDGNGTISFNIQDIFNTRSRIMYTFTESYDNRNFMQWIPRTFSLSLTYRFKEGEKVEQPKRKKDINNNVQGGDDQPPM